MADYTWYEVPLATTPQTLKITLNNVTYRFDVIYRNALEGGWFLDIYDNLGNAIVQGIPLVTGVDLMAAYPDKSIGGPLIVTTDGDIYATPSYTNLGAQSHLYFGVLV